MMGIHINDGWFEIGRKIGSGSFGIVYSGLDTKMKKEVAIKIESNKCKASQLKHEVEIYKMLQGSRGLPTLIWHGKQEGCNVMVLNLLGPSLQNLRH